jgi:hypothetical protein
MLKAVGTYEGKDAIIIGLSRQNRSRLEQGETIAVDLDHAGLQWVLLLVPGTTDVKLLRQLERDFGDEGGVTIKIGPRREPGGGG